MYIFSRQLLHQTSKDTKKVFYIHKKTWVVAPSYRNTLPWSGNKLIMLTRGFTYCNRIKTFFQKQNYWNMKKSLMKKSLVFVAYFKAARFIFEQLWCQMEWGTNWATWALTISIINNKKVAFNYCLHKIV